MKQKNYQIIILIAIIAIACFFRLWNLDAIPNGLFPDEAANGQDAISILNGYHSPFFERGLGREALYFYLIAGSIYLFGVGVWQIHLVSALIGIFTVIATFFLGKILFNQRVAFLASFFMATSAWHVTLSRTGFRAILVPLFATLFFYFILKTVSSLRHLRSDPKRGISSGKNLSYLWAALAGINLGLGFYTYISFRSIIGIVGLMAVLFLITILIRKNKTFKSAFSAKRYATVSSVKKQSFSNGAKTNIFKKYFSQIIVALVFAFLVLSPLLAYFHGHPDAFVGRAGCVSIFNPDLNNGNVVGTFLDVFKKTMLMFFTDGDLNWRHNVSGFSMLNPWVASLFAFGILLSLIIILKGFKKIVFRQSCSENFFKHCLLMFWFFGMLAPELLTAEAIPHGLRAIGVLSIIFFWPALSIDFLWEKAKKFLNKKIIFLAITFAFLLSPILPYDYNQYFKISAESPDFHYAYRSDLTEVSKYLNERNLKNKTYLVLDEYSVQTPEFLTSENNQPYILLNPEKSFQTSLSPGDQIIFTQSTIFDSKKYIEYHPEVKIIQRRFNKFGEEVMRVYEY
jgi:4-amino-4-deoxy-L-arabinose transferase-like glycosyltransferase